MTILTPRQCAAARYGLGLSVRNFAPLAGVCTQTVIRFENSESGTVSTRQAIRAALESLGVEFVGTNGVIFPDSADFKPTGRPKARVEETAHAA